MVPPAICPNGPDDTVFVHLKSSGIVYYIIMRSLVPQDERNGIKS
jgi:hypothetical protein